MKKKVLLILHLPQPIHGASIIGKSIKESAFINNTIEADFINLSTSESIKNIGSINFYKIIHILKLQAQVLSHLLRKKYNLCYMTLTSSGKGFYKDVFIVFILKLLRKKIVYHFHNKGIANSQKYFINHLLYKFTFNNSSLILLSPFLFDDVKRYFKIENVLFCPNGIENNSNYKFLYKNSSPLKVLFFSNMLVSKGALILLKACKIIKNENINFECHFVGEWADISADNFNKQVDELELNNVVFSHGRKNGLEKNTYFENANIFVLPTLQDCFPLVLLEAMSFGLPLISTSEGAIPEILENNINGFIVPKNDSVILADKIKILLLDDLLRKKMSDANVEKFKSKYTLEKFEENFSNILKQIA